LISEVKDFYPSSFIPGFAIAERQDKSWEEVDEIHPYGAKMPHHEIKIFCREQGEEQQK